MSSGKKTLYFDCFSGISGDMACGAFADLTGREEVGQLVIRDLKLVDVKAEVVKRNSFGIAGKGFEVSWDRREKVPRNLEYVKELFENSSLPDDVIENSLRAFTLLAQAESRVHGISPDRIHFHEIGAVDSIIDIGTFFYYLHILKADFIYCSELPSGTGAVEIEHGTYPIPAPATLELLRGTGAVMKKAEFEGEAVTPTGAALVVTAGARFQQPRFCSLTGIGYGIGQMVIPERPNILRVIEGEALFAPAGDRAVIVETNVDDMNPQHVEILMERMFEMGVLDFYITPVQMKKNRPGWLFTVIVEEKNFNGAISALFSFTTTTGIRVTEARRVKLPRAIEEVETSYGSVAVKVIEFPDDCKRAVPEYDDVKRISRDHGVTVAELLKEVDRVWRKEK